MKSEPWGLSFLTVMENLDFTCTLHLDEKERPGQDAFGQVSKYGKLEKLYFLRLQGALHIVKRIRG